MPRAQRQRTDGMTGDYPANWPAIAIRVKEAAGGRCERCGHAIAAYPSQQQRRRHCSGACRKAAHTVTYSCQMCGRERTVPRSETAKRFCGDPCRLRWFSRAFRAERSVHWKGGRTEYYGPNWKRQRTAALRRDRNRCRNCGFHRNWFGEELSVAHVRPFRSFEGDWRRANRLSNLLVLCRCCHIKHDWANGHRS